MTPHFAAPFYAPEAGFEMSPLTYRTRLDFQAEECVFVCIRAHSLMTGPVVFSGTLPGPPM